MENNLFYSKTEDKEEKNKKPLNFKIKKENTLNSLNEVEHFLHNYKHFSKYIKLYKWFKD